MTKPRQAPRFRHTDRPGFLMGFVDFFTDGLFFLFYMPLSGLQDELDAVTGRKTMRYWKAYLLGIPTLFIYPLVWMSRIAEELKAPPREMVEEAGERKPRPVDHWFLDLPGKPVNAHYNRKAKPLRADFQEVGEGELRYPRTCGCRRFPHRLPDVSSWPTQRAACERHPCAP